MRTSAASGSAERPGTACAACIAGHRLPDGVDLMEVTFGETASQADIIDP